MNACSASADVVVCCISMQKSLLGVFVRTVRKECLQGRSGRSVRTTPDANKLSKPRENIEYHVCVCVFITRILRCEGKVADEGQHRHEATTRTRNSGKQAGVKLI